MKTLAIIGASYLQRPLVEKAKAMGLRTICFAWAEGAVCKDIVDVFYPISIVEKEQILAICQQEHIDGICTIASDVAAPTVAYVAEQMGLVGNSYEASLKANNKYLMRQAFVDAGVPCPQFFCVTQCEECFETQINTIHSTMYLPLIVKPSDRSGSLGVTKVNTWEQLVPAIEQALSLSFKHEAMVEEFIEGDEISVEYISYSGTHYPLQITDKVTTGAPHFVELEHHQPSALPKAICDEVHRITQKALTALGITNGASHSEYRITPDGRIYVMEIGGRMGGDFIGSDLVLLSTGYDFLRGVIDVALGKFKAPKLTIDKITGVKYICSNIQQLTCSADRQGYYIYRTNTPIIDGQEKIMIIGAGAGQVPLIREAKQRELYTMVVSIDGNYPGIYEADQHLIVDIFDKELILEIARQEKIQYILSDQSDFSVPTVAYVAEKLGLKGNSIETAEIFTNKQKQREFCLEHNYKVPHTQAISGECDDITSITIPFPWVVKPVDSQGSRGISIVSNYTEARCALKDALNYSKTKEIVVEEYFKGREIVCEGWVMDGEYYNIAFADRLYFNIPNKFIPSQTIFPSTIDEQIKNLIIKQETDLVKKANVQFGIIHSEYLVNDQGEYCLVETALRGGGVYISSHLIPYSYNIDLTKLLLDYVLYGKEKAQKHIERTFLNKVSAYICFYLQSGDIIKVEGLEQVTSHPQVIQADLNEYRLGYNYTKINHKGNRLGPILVGADNHTELQQLTDWLKGTYKIYVNNSKENAIIWE